MCCTFTFNAFFFTLNGGLFASCNITTWLAATTATTTATTVAIRTISTFTITVCSRCFCLRSFCTLCLFTDSFCNRLVWSSLKNRNRDSGFFSRCLFWFFSRYLRSAFFCACFLNRTLARCFRLNRHGTKSSMRFLQRLSR
ncbi:unannotated protein [freshwater metagenome]|uniref:Unannotated protein n=1 Tax=freshwater metagenome TaxID=449393 RepID=A0A6J6YL04_9ZZZZ